MLLIGSNGRHMQREPGPVHFPLFPTTYFWVSNITVASQNHSGFPVLSTITYKIHTSQVDKHRQWDLMNDSNYWQRKILSS